MKTSNEGSWLVEVVEILGALAVASWRVKLEEAMGELKRMKQEIICL